MSLKYRLITFPLTELAIDRKAVQESLNQACHRKSGPYRIIGVFQTSSHLVLPCEGDPEPPEYVIAPMESVDDEGLAANLHERRYHGFRPLGMVRLPDNLAMGIFARVEGEE